MSACARVPYHTIRHIIVCPPDNRGEFRSSLLLAMIHILMRLLPMLMKLKPMMTIPSCCRSKCNKTQNGAKSQSFIWVFCILPFELHWGLPSPSISIMVGEGVGIGGHWHLLHLKPVIGNAPPPSYCSILLQCTCITDCWNPYYLCIALQHKTATQVKLQSPSAQCPSAVVLQTSSLTFWAWNMFRMQTCSTYTLLKSTNKL